jgi:hypothetical protein
MFDGYSSSDTATLDTAFESLLRSVGVPANAYSHVFSDLFDTTHQNSIIYVSATGNDNNTGTQASPFLTIQRALDSLPERIDHYITIQVGIGTFDGFHLDSLNTRHVDTTSGAASGVTIIGTLTALTVSTGTNAGTTTSDAIGTVQPGFSTLVDNTQTWTVGALKGKLLYIPFSLGGVANYIPIIDNTATTITYCSNTSPAAGTVYSLWDWGTVVNGNARSPSLALWQVQNVTPFVPPIGSKAAVVVGSVGPASSMGNAAIARMKLVAQASGYGIWMRGNTSQLVSYNIAIDATGTILGGVNLPNSGQVQLQNSVITLGTAGVGIASAQWCAINLQGSLVTGSTGTTIGLQSVSGASIVVVSRSLIDNLNQGFNTGGPSAHINSGTIFGFRGCTTAIVAAKGFTLSAAFSISFANCGTCISMSSSGEVLLGACAGVGNTLGISIARGARVQISNTATLGATTEINIDGVNQTLATLRAASPRLLTNTYGTIIYE